ncbi:MAG TPA: head maturation protease, ClpP-related [Actinomycetes bacterium]|jgi:ATP-dependent protease ClpP protease subunit|nr:head maturation protease, ClpP-related [Actinomycetes bacterium]
MDDAGRRRLRLARPVARQGQSWYRIQGKAAEVADVYIYDEISWWGITAQDFVNELREVTAPKVNLHLNSPGGDVFDAHAIYQALVDHPAEVTTLVDSLAASAASVIAMAGERIVMGKAAMLMIHDAWGLAIGNAADMRDMAARLDKISNVIAGVYAERAGGPLEFWRQAMLEESWYDAEEAVAAGLADEVRSRKASSPDDGDGDGQGDGEGQGPEDRWDLSVFTYAGRRKAPAPPIPSKFRPAAHADRPAAGEPGPTDDEALAEAFAGAWAQVADALDEVFDPVSGYDPAMVGTTILDVYADAPAPPAIPPRPPGPRTTVSVDELIDAIQEGVRP